LQTLGLSSQHFQTMVAEERLELERRVRRYRGDRSLPPLGRRDVVLVDDGLATGVTAEAALHALRSQRPRRLVLAVPVCASATAARLQAMADEVVCVLSPSDFHAVGLWYDNFEQTTDAEVLDLLERATGTSTRK
nr:phosphoribosyltransferase [Actinomycetota bacterium]